MAISNQKRAIGFLVIASLLAGAASLIAQQSDAKKDDKKEEPKKEVKKEEPKKDDPKEKPPEKVEPKKADPAAFDTLKAKLKKHEDEILKIREAMLKEVGEEEKRLSEEIKKAKDAQKKGDRDAFAQAAKLQGQKAKLQAMRMDIELRIRVGAPAVPVKPPTPIDKQLGLQTSVPNATLRAQLGLSKDQGLILESVSPGSPADKAGLKAHDVLLQVEDQKVPSDPSAFRKLLAGQKAGDALSVVVLRAGKQETVKGLAMPSAK
jgi:C-terminal processing protease CtpA/Prc